MNRKLMVFSSWLNEHPDRPRALMLTTGIALSLLALIVPEAAALANPIATSGPG